MRKSLTHILKKFVARFTRIFKRRKTALLDTNILFSQVCFNGEASDRFFNALYECNFTIILTKYIIEESKRVIGNKYPARAYKLDKLLSEITYGVVEEPKSFANIPEMRDEKDRPILAAAIYNKVDFLISGDKDFLVLKDVVTKPRILTMAEFLELFG